jgi:hypothetical protein
MRNSRWLRLLAYVTGSVNQELLVRNEYLAAENRILRTKLPARLRLFNPERITLAEIGKLCVAKTQSTRRREAKRIFIPGLMERAHRALSMAGLLPNCQNRPRTCSRCQYE